MIIIQILTLEIEREQKIPNPEKTCFFVIYTPELFLLLYGFVFLTSRYNVRNSIYLKTNTRAAANYKIVKVISFKDNRVRISFQFIFLLLQ